MNYQIMWDVLWKMLVSKELSEDPVYIHELKSVMKAIEMTVDYNHKETIQHDENDFKSFAEAIRNEIIDDKPNVYKVQENNSTRLGIGDLPKNY